MTKVNTLFGSFDEDQLKKLKGYVDEVVLHMNRNKNNNDAIKDIIDVILKDRDLDVTVVIAKKWV